MKKIFLLLMAIFVVSAVEAQELTTPRKVENVTIKDISGNTVTLPEFGKKNLLIFYVDPDSYMKGGANKKLSDELEENGRAAGAAIRGFGVMNFPDTGLPKNMVRNMARKRSEKNGATILDDDQQLLKNEWGLGDCNNKFVLLLVSKEGELIFCRKGEFTEEDKKEFFEAIEPYR